MSEVIGRWDHYYAAPGRLYGDDTTYMMAAAWVRDCATVEDWGCGERHLEQFIRPPAAYVGVDGSGSYADVREDLALRKTTCEGLVMRHVLEHNHNWADILDNAIRSATKRLFIALYTPEVAETHPLPRPDVAHCPVIAFRLADIMGRLAGWGRWMPAEKVVTQGDYGQEIVLRAVMAP
jgi:hypothetical protein